MTQIWKKCLQSSLKNMYDFNIYLPLYFSTCIYVYKFWSPTYSKQAYPHTSTYHMYLKNISFLDWHRRQKSSTEFWEKRKFIKGEIIDTKYIVVLGFLFSKWNFVSFFPLLFWGAVRLYSCTNNVPIYKCLFSGVILTSV